MQLLKSLFCFQGSDNRSRFLVINIATYILFLISNSAFSNQLFFNILILLCLVSVITLSSLRRLNDAQLNKSWCAGPSLSFLITCLIIAFTTHDSANWLLLAPIVLSALLLTYPSKLARTYILGYFGPVDLSEFEQGKFNQQRHNQRIEPTLLTGLQNQESLATNAYLPEQTFSNEDSSISSNFNGEASIKQSKNEQDIGETIRLKLLSSKNAKLTLIAVSSLILLTVIISFIVSAFKDNIELEDPTTKSTALITRTAKISFPDNFSLLLSLHQGLIINWQADSTTDSQIWSLNTAQGDTSCQEVVFNNGKKFRTTSVMAESGEQYFANFSPLDTQNLLQEIAFRGNFKLCGYQFSLKGSQAILGKHPEYADKVNY